LEECKKEREKKNSDSKGAHQYLMVLNLSLSGIRLQHSINTWLLVVRTWELLTLIAEDLHNDSGIYSEQE
jgi:hypothetical protein